MIDIKWFIEINIYFCELIKQVDYERKSEHRI